MFSDQEFIKQCSDPSEFDEEFKEGSDSRSKIWAYNIVSSAFKKVIKYWKTKENIDSLTSLHINECFEDSRIDINNMIDFNKKFDLMLNTIGFSILKEFNELKPLIDSENLFCHPIHSNLIEIKNKDEGKRIYNKNNANLNIKNSTSNEQIINDNKLKDTYIDKSLPPLKDLVKIVVLNQDDKMINTKRYEINKIRNFECPRNQVHQKDTLLEDSQNLNMSKSKEEIDALWSPITKLEIY